ncbi:peptidoglycan-binding domain-containing protein [Tepidibacter hydrothermalis]|uniref:Peptidoglycan-binding domain-containing protein n=1 Tax=Tepidibacter hydrothermalis TaxID=3036126 RepID=A0ABY8EGN3_9FIRM|nr:peptidoglycan-binding domain-containing protein [Tepidibacter hydrothermalis]WFD12099.1 peptidoglycan-binding domain-containing protein [Tepidibacter hydrothermalis]
MKKIIISTILSLGIALIPLHINTANAYTQINSSLLLKTGIRNQNVVLLQNRLKELGYFPANPTGYYGSITKQSVLNFQKANNLVADGIAGKNTIQKLNSLNIKNTPSVTRGSSTTSSNWSWFSKIQYAIPRGATFEVLDIYSGKSFKANRTYGTNHIDAETISEYDTSIYKSVFGGNWSWSKRPIVVTYNGISLPASMAGMPHAGNDNAPSAAYTTWRSDGYGAGTNLDAIKNNGMHGVFDIHFIGSRTHSSNRVDNVHQNNIKIAQKYIGK